MKGGEGKCAAREMVAVTQPEYGNGAEKRSTDAVDAMKKDLPSCSQNADQLRSMFDEWAKKYNKVYTSDEEREERFANFLSTKRYVDNANNSKGRTATLGLNAGADRRACEIPTGFGNPGMPISPEYQKEFEFHFDPDTSEMSEMSCEELTEARIEFEEWAVKHGKVYATKEEREKRFGYYLSNKSMYVEDLKEQGELYISDDFNNFDEVWTRMDLQWWELPPVGPPHGSKHGQDCLCLFFSENSGAST